MKVRFLLGVQGTILRLATHQLRIVTQTGSVIYLMKKIFIFLLLIICGVYVFHPPVFAKYDPLTVPNNKYGIHIVDTNDISDAAKLVNSNGGDWGYVTLVIQDDDRDKGKWQRVFNDMRALHLVPIVRIATHIDRDAWVKPYKDSASDWAKFLHELNWPVENRYVIVFNEPNHANEWGRTINPEEYASTLLEHAQKIHEASEDFFVLPAGLDVSAASNSRSLDAAVYLRRMIAAEPQLFDHLDGWTSHSYPNPGFSGSPYAVGRGTLRSYLWEREYLKQLGIIKALPIFITETGWLHREGVSFNPGLLTSEQVGNNLQLANMGAWQDPNVVAITPFVLNYQGLPFDHFSWRKLNSNEFYPHYTSYLNISKASGQPRQREHYTIERELIPDTLVAGSTYALSSLLKNEGQGILSAQDDYRVTLDIDKKFLAVSDPLPVMEPGQYGTLTLHVETPKNSGTYPYRVSIDHWERSAIVESGTIKIVPPPSVTLSIHLGWRSDNNATNATILIYDQLTLIHKVPGVDIKNGKATVRELHNVVPGNTYRVVVLVPYYLPRQKIIMLGAETTTVPMPRLYPLDFNLDGALTTLDLFSLLKLPPNFIISLIIGQ